MEPSHSPLDSGALLPTLHVEQARDAPKLFVVRVTLRQGEDSEGTFEVRRKRKDFDTLRTLLLLYWPGAFVPPIHKDESALEAFLQRVAAIPYLFNCSVMRHFLHTPSAFSKKAAELKTISYQTVLDAVLQAFQQTEDRAEPMETAAQLLQAALERMKRIKAHCKYLSSLHFNFASTGDRLEKSFEHFETDVLTECARGQEESVEIVPAQSLPREDPNTVLYAWARREVREFRCMLEALATPLQMREDLQEFEDRLKGYSRNIERLQQGRATVGSVLLLRRKAVELSRKEASSRWVAVTQTEVEVEAIRKLIPCVEARLSAWELPHFETERRDSYRAAMREYASLSSASFSQMLVLVRARGRESVYP